MAASKQLRWTSIAATAITVVLGGTLADPSSAAPEKPAAAPDTAAQNGPRRHSSGILILDQEPVNYAPEDLRDAVGAYDVLAMVNPDDFGYVRVVGGAIVVDVVTDKGRARFEAMRDGRELLPAADNTRFGQHTHKLVTDGKKRVKGKAAVERRAKDSRARTERIREELFEENKKGTALASAGIWGMFVDQITGRVILQLEKLTDAAAARIVSLYGVEKVAILEQPRLLVTPLTGTRLWDTSPFNGGARINVPTGQCTSAFAWRIDETNSYGMLSAGHCFPAGGGMYTPAQLVGGVIWENWQPGEGTIQWPGDQHLRGDFALAKVTPGRSSQAVAYRGPWDGAGPVNVAEMWHRMANPGDQYCTSGSFSGEICGWAVLATDRWLSISNTTAWWRNVVLSQPKWGPCIGPGDSGGAVYTMRMDGKMAGKGIINGVTQYSDGRCASIFTDIWKTYGATHGYPMTRV